MAINEAGLAIINQFEVPEDGDKRTPGLDPYLCPAGVATIGYGRALRGSDGKLLKGPAGLAEAKRMYPNGITMAQAVAYRGEDIAAAEAAIDRLTKGVKLNPNQRSALISFVFNVGGGNFAESNMLRLIKVGKFQAAANEFPKWKFSNGKVMNGLIKRRALERDLFLRPVTPLAGSPIVHGSLLAAMASLVSFGQALADVQVPLMDAVSSAQALHSAVSGGVDLWHLANVFPPAVALVGAGITIKARVSDWCNGK